MVTGMEEAKRKMMEDGEEDKVEDKKEPDEDFKGNESRVSPRDKTGDDVMNEIDNEAFVKSLGTIAYIDFSEF